jgi:hypothetical protein
MSLKAVHILFILASTLLCFGFAAWAIASYLHEEPRNTVNLGMGIFSAVLGVALVIYGRYFLKKLKDVSYL